MSDSNGISPCRHAGPLIAAITGTSMFSRFISRARPSQCTRSNALDVRPGPIALWPGVARTPDHSSPVPVRITTRLSRSRATSAKASGSSPCGPRPQRSGPLSVWNRISRMPFSRRMWMHEYFVA